MNTPSREHPADPHVCARCAEEHTTCCFVTPGEEEYCFPLSNTEWERIVEHCQDKGGFAEERNTKPFITTLVRLFPAKDTARIRELFPEHGTHRRLASRPDGKCAFLTDTGCQLPREVRPWYCLLYPFWKRGHMLTMFTAMGCLVCRETTTTEEALDLVGMTKKDVHRIFGQLRLAWGLDPDADQ